MQATGKAANFLVRRQHPMTGYQNRNRIRATSATHGTNGFGFAYGFRDFTIAFGFAERNLEHGLPNGFLEVSFAGPIEGWEIRSRASGENIFQRASSGLMPAKDLCRQPGSTLFPEDLIHSPPRPRLGKIQAGQALFRIMRDKNAGAGRDREFKQGCFHRIQWL